MNKDVEVDVEKLLGEENVTVIEEANEWEGVYYNSQYNRNLMVKDYQIYTVRNVGGSISKGSVEIEWEHTKYHYEPYALLPDFYALNPYTNSQKTKVPVITILQSIMKDDFNISQYKNVYYKKYQLLHNRKNVERERIDLNTYQVGSVFTFKNKDYIKYFVVKEQDEYVMMRFDKNRSPKHQLNRIKLINEGKKAFFYVEGEDQRYWKIFNVELEYLLEYNEKLTQKIKTSKQYKEYMKEERELLERLANFNN